MTKKIINSDAIIIGGGLVGLSLAIALAKSGLDITVIEAFDPKKTNDKKFDGRASSIAYGSAQIFKTLGVWQEMEKKSGKILDIRIVDDSSPLFLHYDHKEVGDEPMGYIIENRFIRKSLFKELSKLDNINFLAPETYENIEYNPTEVVVDLKSGSKVKAKLLIAADGRNSRIREKVGIKATRLDYNQTGIVCTVEHQKNHQGVAIEKFLPSGPFAMLPMEGGHHSSIVWTEKSELAPIFADMNDKDFTKEVADRFGKHFGKIKIVGPRWQYPISLCFAEEYTSPRMCLIGDAAHGIHPIAGQGFNLGLRDIAVLAELIVDHWRLGLDIGGDSLLSQYERVRRIDNVQMIAVTDGLNRLFSNNIVPIKMARRVGLGVVEKLPGLKKIFMRHAMGIAGKAPKLVKGEKI